MKTQPWKIACRLISFSELVMGLSPWNQFIGWNLVICRFYNYPSLLWGIHPHWIYLNHDHVTVRWILKVPWESFRNKSDNTHFLHLDPSISERYTKSARDWPMVILLPWRLRRSMFHLECDWSWESGLSNMRFQHCLWIRYAKNSACEI